MLSMVTKPFYNWPIERMYKIKSDTRREAWKPGMETGGGHNSRVTVTYRLVVFLRKCGASGTVVYVQ